MGTRTRYREWKRLFGRKRMENVLKKGYGGVESDGESRGNSGKWHNFCERLKKNGKRSRI